MPTFTTIKAPPPSRRPRVCFIGGTRYHRPVEPETEKKFRLLDCLGEIFAVGFSENATTSRFSQSAHFYLLPKVSPAPLRYALMFLAGPILAGYLVLRHSVWILIAQSPYEGGVAALVKLAARLCGRKVAVVIESHGDFEAVLFVQRKIRFIRLYRFLMDRMARFALRHADVLRAVSMSTRSQLQRYVPDKPLVQFATWTDLDLFFSAEPSNRDDGPVVLYAGVLTPLKGVHILLEAFLRLASEFPDARLLIVGEPEDRAYERRLKGSLGESRLLDRVSFKGRVPQQDLADHMARARVLVLPSLAEGLPRVVFEAMACGTPVIGSAVGGIPELIEDGVNGFLVEPGNRDALAMRLRWMLENPIRCLQMGREARRFARDTFSIAKYREGYAEVLRLAGDAVRLETC